MIHEETFEKTEALTRMTLQLSSMDRKLFFDLPDRCLEIMNEACVEAARNKDYEDRLELKIALQLASQLMQDFRSCTLLARMGYAGPAASVACSMYEGFYIFAVMRLSSDRVREWKEIYDTTDLNDYKKNPLGYGDARDLFYSHVLGSPDSEVAKEVSRGLYTHLSAMRHYNPRARQRLGLIPHRDSDGRTGFVPSPYAASLGYGTVYSRYVMLGAIRYAAYIINHLSSHYFRKLDNGELDDISLDGLSLFRELEELGDWFDNDPEARAIATPEPGASS
ncbi:hypothetical protein [Deinococcus aestuarii]|uniref:hypothetical protein n=1 Tax=Deinococcus aestuarii TaxID=2774531 RepID=UPI001C0B3CF5|nr:hypothetical protein [Deinococcus aestuarii]